MTYLPFLWCRPSWPEEMWACADSSTLVWFLEEFGGSQGTLSSKRFVVLISKATHLFKRADNKRNGCKLGFAITDLIFVEWKCLQRKFCSLIFFKQISYWYFQKQRSLALTFIRKNNAIILSHRIKSFPSEAPIVNWNVFFKIGVSSQV